MKHQNRQSDAHHSLGTNDTVVPHIRPRDINRTPFGPTRTPDEQAALTELDAMHLVAEALSTVPEEETRARVLAWATRLFTVNRGSISDVVSEAQAADASRIPEPPVDVDDALSLDSLETIFAADRVPRKRIPTPKPRLQPRALVTIRFRWRR